MVEMLVALGVDIGAMTSRNWPSNDCKKGMEILRIFVSAGVDPSLHKSRLFTSAVQRRDPEAVKYLLQNGAKVTANIISQAVQYFHPEVMNVLISVGADISDWLPSLLLLSTAQSNYPFVQKLIDMGADVNCRFGRPFLYACSSLNMRMVRLLLRGGANPNTKTFKTVVCCLPWHRNSIPVLDLLIEHGLVVGTMVLKLAIVHLDRRSEGSVAFLEKVLRHVVDITDSYGILKDAFETGNSKLIDRLIALGAPIDLLEAVRMEDPDFLKILIRACANPGDYLAGNSTCSNLLDNGFSPHGDSLLVAVQKSSLDIAQILMEAGADPNAGNPSPFQAACGNIEMRQLLEIYGGR
ncbi:hypothetical protein HDU76_006345 [Blyttiomyces sp. JEL0837]|nr:hypothetical protein HDU76_006345 [Blyttiomyces sp. JEL0837]